MTARCLVCIVLLAACAAARPLVPDVPVNQTAVFQRELGALAEQLFTELAAERFDGVLVPRSELDRLLTPSGRIAVERERESQASSLANARVAWAWSGASYRGFCVQDLHRQPGGDGFGLKQDAWVVERMLVVADKQQARSAAWVEGRFFHTNRGWKALSIGRIEPPRAHHTDLEQARCDVEAGIR